MLAIILAICMPCQDVKLDRASFYLMSAPASTTAALPSKSDKQEQATEKLPARSRYYIRSGDC